MAYKEYLYEEFNDAEECLIFCSCKERYFFHLSFCNFFSLALRRAKSLKAKVKNSSG